jgi:hypothetical protein
MEAGTVAVLGKGRNSKMKLTLPPETRKALEAWLGARGVAPGPLFCSMNRAKPGKGRLSAIGLYGMVRELGRRLGFKVWRNRLPAGRKPLPLDAKPKGQYVYHRNCNTSCVTRAGNLHNDAPRLN